MNEEDLRDCFAMFAMVGLLFRENYEAGCLADMAYHQADKMLEARKQKDNDDEEDDSGIASVAPKRTRRKSR